MLDPLMTFFLSRVSGRLDASGNTLNYVASFLQKKHIRSGALPRA